MIARATLAAALGLGAAAPVMAEPWVCDFTVACTAGLPCEATRTPAELIAADHEGQLFVALDGVQYLARRLSDTSTYSAQGPDGALLLSIATGGAAWLTRHGPQVTTFLGSCEAQ